MRKLILHNRQSPGDIVMLTAAVRDLKRARPDWQIDVRTSAPELWENNPHITPLRENEPGVEVIKCGYPLIHKSNQLPFHFIHGFRMDLEGKLGIPIPQGPFHGDIHLSDEEKSWTNQVEEVFGHKGDFWIIVAGGKFDFTAKWWSPAYYQEVVDVLAGKVQFVQCGESKHWHPPLENVFSLVGQTDLRQFVRLMYHAAGVICPVTMAMHLAAAVPTKPGHPKRRPCVVIAGGREPTHWEAYPAHQFLHTVGVLPCCEKGGCWRSRCHKMGDGSRKDRRKLCEHPVPAGKISIPRCMDMITPDDVCRAVNRYRKGAAIRRGERFRAKREIAFAHMKRAAGHPVMDWIVSQVEGETLFMNSVGKHPLRRSKRSSRLPSLGDVRRPLSEFRGRDLSLVICSYEDNPVDEVIFQEADVEAEARTRVVLIRDPFNHLASTVAMGRRKNDWTLIHKPKETGEPTREGVARWAERWKHYARECLRIVEQHDPTEVAINYNRWLSDEAYRDELFGWLALDRRTDAAMDAVPLQGAGSSFERRKLNGSGREGKYLQRWQTVADKPWFRDAFKDRELIELSEQLFGPLPGTEALIEAGKETVHA